MKTQSVKTYGQPIIGCYLDQSYRNACKHDAETIRLAMNYGYQPDRFTLNLLARCDCDVLSDARDDAQLLSECADEAIDWLNGQETRPFLYWANDGEANAFGLWPNVDGAREDCGFVSSKRQEYPDDDFRGEWLHVSDRGNATLYVREETLSDSVGGMHPRCVVNDREIWSVG